MRSYGQFCALARALDVIGDRWTLLIIRELFSRDSRYSDLRDGLPGIATNLLADRLRHLETAGVIESHQAPRPIGTTVYRLTRRGRDLAPALRALVEWGLPLAATGQGDDAFRTHWLVPAVRTFYRDVEVSDLAPLTVAIDTEGEPATLRVDRNGLTIDIGPAPAADDLIVVTGTPERVAALLGGASPPIDADLRVHGPREARRRLRELTSRSRTRRPAAGPVDRSGR